MHDDYRWLSWAPRPYRSFRQRRWDHMMYFRSFGGR